MIKSETIVLTQAELDALTDKKNNVIYVTSDTKQLTIFEGGVATVIGSLEEVAEPADPNVFQYWGTWYPVQDGLGGTGYNSTRFSKNKSEISASTVQIDSDYFDFVYQADDGGIGIICERNVVGDTAYTGTNNKYNLPVGTKIDVEIYVNLRIDDYYADTYTLDLNDWVCEFCTVVSGMGRDTILVPLTREVLSANQVKFTGSATTTSEIKDLNCKNSTLTRCFGLSLRNGSNIPLTSVVEGEYVTDEANGKLSKITITKG